MEIVDNLVHDIQSAWATQGFREAAFPEIAARALADAGLSEASAQDLFFDHVMESRALVNNHVAQNMVTLYDGPRFTVHLHLWKDGGITLHQHEWGGAYQVLNGSSIAAIYSFESIEAVRRGLLIGELKQRNVRLVQTGDLQPIEPGSSFIHGLSYISKTALTISVRTRKLYDTTSMWYLRPSVGIRPLSDSSTPTYIIEQVRALTFLRDADSRQHRKRLMSMVAHVDPLISFAALRHAQTSQVDDEDLNALCKAGVRTHGAVFHLLFESSRDLRCIEYLSEMRRQAPESEWQIRTLLSLLYACYDCHELVRATSDIVDTDVPIQWLTTNMLHMLERASGDENPSSLEGVAEVLRHLLAGVTVDTLVAELSRDYDLDPDERQSVLDIAAELLENPGFRALRVHSIPPRVNRCDTPG